MHLSKTLGLSLRRGLPVAMAAGLIATVAPTIPGAVAANDDSPGRACSNRTLDCHAHRRSDESTLWPGTSGAGLDQPRPACKQDDSADSRLFASRLPQ